MRNWLLLAVVAAVVGGCASANVSKGSVTAAPRSKPDVIVVYDFAVAPSDVKLDRGVMAAAFRDTEERQPNEEEMKVGRMVSDKLSTVLVEELRKKGIAATRSSSPVQITPTTAQLYGQFVTVDQGNQTVRVWIGFGLGGSDTRTRAQIVQNGELVQSVETATKASLKPGIIGAVTTEIFTADVEADATRTAKALAERIHQAYLDRGWLTK
jgi:hypothetical protein